VRSTACLQSDANTHRQDELVLDTPAQTAHSDLLEADEEIDNRAASSGWGSSLTQLMISRS